MFDTASFVKIGDFCLAMPSNSTLGLKIAFFELEGIAIQVVEVSHLGGCACFGN